MENNPFDKYIILINIIFVFLLIEGCNSPGKFPLQKYKDLNDRKTFRLVFYNTENFYDIEDDPLVQDDDFTPEGSRHWTYKRYKTKLANISKTLVAAGEWEQPEIICLAEIENRKILENLIVNTPLSEGNYDIVHKESPDARGIDVAMLYKKAAFKLVFYKFIHVEFSKNARPTRDILYAKGVVLKSGDTIHIFIVHSPSRVGGQEESEPKRIFVASLIKIQVDSVIKANPLAKIIITGDFNDNPEDKSISVVLDAGNDTISNIQTHQLYNCMLHLRRNDMGSIRYKYEWHLFDQFMISKSFFDKNSRIYTTTHDSHIFHPDFLLIEDKKFGGSKPFETYNGMKYMGGYSDHLPVYIDLNFR